MATLKQECATLESEKKTLYSGYNTFKRDAKNLSAARHNVNKILNAPAADELAEQTVRERELEAAHPKRKSYSYER
ncbi:MAG: hypothetical protein LBB94_07345 [Clostridiales bacterium]|jgi:hypothetical protein|nr:hypothetical protein [Clostridiales bacterium]